VTYKIRNSGLRISACGVRLQIHAGTPFFVHEIQQIFCDGVKKFHIITTKNAILLNFFSMPLKSSGTGDLKSLNGSRRESVKRRMYGVVETF
jgi:hypothetical protein